MTPPELSRTEPLGLTVHSMPAPADIVQRQRAGGRLKMLMVLAVCAAPVLLSYFMFYVVQPTGSAYSALIQPVRPMPALTATDLDGRAVALPSLRGQWLMVVVNGSACDAGCEARLYMQRQLREMTGRERDRLDKLWLVTDDGPVSPALREALMAVPGMNILRVPRDAVAAWLQPAAGARLEDHLYLVDPVGDWMMRAPVDADPAKLKRDIDRLLRASASWDKAGRQQVREAPPAASSGTR